MCPLRFHFDRPPCLQDTPPQHFDTPYTTGKPPFECKAIGEGEGGEMGMGPNRPKGLMWQACHQAELQRHTFGAC